MEHLLLGVIGDPIEHSLSPLMHQRWYEQLGLPHHYHAFHLTKEGLENGIKGFKALNIKGFNVTIPHKVGILSLLDEIDEEAQALGAVNTVVNQNGHLKGFNTDGRGLVSALNETWPDLLKGAKVLILGAGGASKGVALTLAKEEVAELAIANRTFEAALALSEDCRAFTSSKALKLKEAETQLADYTMVINTTPIGMAPKWETQLPISLENLREGTYCVDLIYNPLKTKWLTLAEEKGALTMNGLPMLVHQGALAFEHWFKIKPETKTMITYLNQILEVRHANR
ncbi:MAG TPA: shikimate dehydrogenase [Sporolactobacillaceae bacterium]|nr:shikimate dehydrogenase [Sporolactobacillaceae bacterium]